MKKQVMDQEQEHVPTCSGQSEEEINEILRFAAVRCQGPGEGDAALLGSDIERRNPPGVRWIKCAAAATRTATAEYEVGWSILGAALGGSLATEMAVCPSGDSSRMCRVTKATCERSCGSNFCLPRVIRRCGPVFVVALEFGLDTQPAP